MTLRTPLCDLLGIEVPVLQSGMNRIAGPDLVGRRRGGARARRGSGGGAQAGHVRERIALTSIPAGSVPKA